MPWVYTNSLRPYSSTLIVEDIDKTRLVTLQYCCYYTVVPTAITYIQSKRNGLPALGDGITGRTHMDKLIYGSTGKKPPKEPYLPSFLQRSLSEWHLLKKDSFLPLAWQYPDWERAWRSTRHWLPIALSWLNSILAFNMAVIRTSQEGLRGLLGNSLWLGGPLRKHHP